MKHNRNRIAAILITVSALALACAVIPASPTATPTPSPVPPTSTVTPTPPPTLTPTPSYPIEMGGPVNVRSAGFMIDRIKGYDLYDDNGGVYMKSDDNKVQVTLFAYAPPRGYTISNLAKQYGENLGERYTDFVLADPVKGIFGEVDTITSEYTGLADDEPVHGVFAIYEPEDSKHIYLIVEAFGEQRWEREGQRAFEQVSASLSIFPIQAYENCPVHQNGGYGTSPDWPIQIGGGLLLGQQRTDDYLNALLGLRGEPVGYYREGTVDGKNGTLDKYTIYWGNRYSTLYFDIYNYSKISAPSGLTCSVLLPMAP